MPKMSTEQVRRLLSALELHCTLLSLQFRKNEKSTWAVGRKARNEKNKDIAVDLRPPAQHGPVISISLYEVAMIVVRPSGLRWFVSVHAYNFNAKSVSTGAEAIAACSRVLAGGAP
jgi:hypothetical protein